MIEEYFRLLLTFQNALPEKLVQSAALSPILQLSTAAVSSMHYYACEAVLDYLKDLLMLGFEDAELFSMIQLRVQEHGYSLIGHIIQAMCNTMPQDLLMDGSIVVEMVAKLCPGQISEWLVGMMFLENSIEKVKETARKQDWQRLRRQIHDLTVQYRRRHNKQ